MGKVSNRKSSCVNYSREEFSRVYGFKNEKRFDDYFRKWRNRYDIDPQIFRAFNEPRANIEVEYEMAPLVALSMRSLPKNPIYRKNANSSIVSNKQIADYNKLILKEIKKLPSYARDVVMQQSGFLETYKMTFYLPTFVEYFAMLFSSLIQFHADEPDKIMSKMIYQVRNWIFESFKSRNIDEDIPAYTSGFTPSQLDDIVLPFPDSDLYVEFEKRKLPPKSINPLPIPTMLNEKGIQMATFDQTILQAINQLKRKDISEVLSGNNDLDTQINDCMSNDEDLRNRLRQELTKQLNLKFSLPPETLSRIDKVFQDCAALGSQFSFPLRRSCDEYVMAYCKRNKLDIDNASVLDVWGVLMEWKNRTIKDRSDHAEIEHLCSKNFMDIWNASPLNNSYEIPPKQAADAAAIWKNLSTTCDHCEAELNKLKQKPFYKHIYNSLDTAIGQMYMGMMYFEQAKNAEKKT